MAKTPPHIEKAIQEAPYSETAEALAAKHDISVRTVRRIRKKGRQRTAEAVRDELSERRREDVGTAMDTLKSVRANALVMFEASGDSRYGKLAVDAACAELRYLVPTDGGDEFKDMTDEELDDFIESESGEPGAAGEGGEGEAAPAG